MRLVGVGGDGPEPLAREFARLLARGPGNGFDTDALPTVVQAYARAVGRVAAAEADVVRGALTRAEPAERTDVLERFIALVLPAGERGFATLHGAFLHDELEEVVDELDAGAQPAMAVALVDLVGSTAYLAESSPTDLEHLVDVLFVAGQTATVDRSAHAVKYVGDGVFIAGADAGAVVDAALQTLGELQQELPLTARAGIAHGSVSRRAGDVFGLPVNRSQLLCKQAVPGTALADAATASLLDAGRRGTTRTVSIHAALPRERVTEVKSG